MRTFNIYNVVINNALIKKQLHGDGSPILGTYFTKKAAENAVNDFLNELSKENKKFIIDEARNSAGEDWIKHDDGPYPVGIEIDKSNRAFDLTGVNTKEDLDYVDVNDCSYPDAIEGVQCNFKTNKLFLE